VAQERFLKPVREAGILPLNYSRLPYFSSTYLFSKDLSRSTASLFRLLRPSKTMGFDRKMDSKVDSKSVWEASPPPFSFTVHFTVHPTTDSTYHTGRPLGEGHQRRFEKGMLWERCSYAVVGTSKRFLMERRLGKSGDREPMFAGPQSDSQPFWRSVCDSRLPRSTQSPSCSGKMLRKADDTKRSKPWILPQDFRMGFSRILDISESAGILQARQAERGHLGSSYRQKPNELITVATPKPVVRQVRTADLLVCRHPFKAHVVDCYAHDCFIPGEYMANKRSN
jgi:hypothetical protein